MAFSFNPGQQASSAPQPQAVPVQAQQASVAPVGGAGVTAAPSVPDSPFLFMQHRDQEMTVNAYIQIVLILVAALSVLIAVVFFLYSMYLSSQISAKKSELDLKNNSFVTYPVAEMQRTYLRMNNLDFLVKNYVSVRSPLKFLESVVEQQVVFNDFSLSRKDGGYVANFTAITTNYRSLIQQLAALNLTEYKKVVPDPKIGKVVDGVTTLKINVTTPVFVQGLLPDSVVFTPLPTPKSAATSEVTSTSTQ